MLAALAGLGAALALPPALLTPDGPAWLGPLPPRADGRTGAPWTDLVAVVSPVDGQLSVQERDHPEILRVWDGAGWTVDGARISETWPDHEQLAYTLVDGRLRAVAGANGQQRFAYDPEGRLVRIRWPDGSQLRAEYADDGRVKRLTGPGISRWTFEWRPDGLRATDALGRVLVARVSEDGSVEVQDALGRTARSTADRSRIEDPRGLSVSWEHRERISLLRDSLARTWTLRRDERGELARLEVPGGGSWAWEYDKLGLMSRVTDPSGRAVRWEYDRAGRVTAEVRGGTVTRYIRDEAGRVVQIASPSGAVLRLSRDAGGYVVAITTPSGNEYAIERFAGGLPLRITDPAGGRWTFGLDLLGRPDLVEDPTGRTTAVTRNTLGRVDRIADSRFGVTLLKRGLAGELNAIEEPGGLQWGLVRDSLGRVMAVQLPDGRTVRLGRDILGEITSISDGAPITVGRDGAGRPVVAGGLSWQWSGGGVLQGVQSPLLDLRFLRDLSGRLEGIEAGGGALWLRLTRDFSGRIVRWEGAEGVITVRRDLNGAIVEREGAGDLRLSRGPDGAVEKLVAEPGTWRWLRDAAGRVLRQLGPHELALGLVRDDAGRITLSRLSTGVLLHRRFVEASVLEHMEDFDGNALSEQLTALDRGGRIVEQQVLDGERIRRSYTPDGRLASIASAEGLVFTRTPEGSFGPGEAMTLNDGQGWLMEARPRAGVAAWGVAEGLLSAFWSEQGALEELVGERGMVRLQHDDFGRLSVVSDPSRGDWALSYDVRGRLRAVTPPDGETVPLLWSPEGDLLAIGERALVVSLPGGAQLWGTESGHGGALWMQGAAPFYRHGSLGQGWPRLTSSGQLALFEGGPLIDGHGAVEPLSGQPTVQPPPTPWAPGARGSAALRPDALMPTSLWHQPLQLMDALGGLASSLSDEGWTRCPAGGDAAGWPDPAVVPPLGPAPGDLPLRDDPFTVALICALLPGGEAPGPGLMREILLHEESERIDVPLDMMEGTLDVWRR